MHTDTCVSYTPQAASATLSWPSFDGFGVWWKCPNQRVKIKSTTSVSLHLAGTPRHLPAEEISTGLHAKAAPQTQLVVYPSLRSTPKKCGNIPEQNKVPQAFAPQAFPKPRRHDTTRSQSDRSLRALSFRTPRSVFLPRAPGTGVVKHLPKLSKTSSTT